MQTRRQVRVPCGAWPHLGTNVASCRDDWIPWAAGGRPRSPGVGRALMDRGAEPHPRPPRQPGTRTLGERWALSTQWGPFLFP